MSDRRGVAFAIPGDLGTVTGGYIYERRVIDELRALGRPVEHVQVAEGFDRGGMAEAVAALERPGADVPLMVDGLILGAIETEGLARVRAPLVGVIHHPLGMEPGLSPARAAELLARERANLDLARHVIVTSPYTARLLVSEFGVPEERLTVALPGMERPSGPALAKAEPPLVLSVGLLHPRKGHDVLLKALAACRDLDWQAAIVGRVHDAGHAAELEALVGALGLAGRARLEGQVGGEALEALYARASVFALATRFEGYGMALAEAMVRGLPVVSCRAGAVGDTVPEAAGILVEPDDVDGLAGALRSVLGDGALRARLAEGAVRAGRALPGWADTAAVIDAVLDRV